MQAEHLAKDRDGFYTSELLARVKGLLRYKLIGLRATPPRIYTDEESLRWLRENASESRVDTDSDDDGEENGESRRRKGKRRSNKKSIPSYGNKSKVNRAKVQMTEVERQVRTLDH